MQHNLTLSWNMGSNVLRVWIEQNISSMKTIATFPSHLPLHHRNLNFSRVHGKKTMYLHMTGICKLPSHLYTSSRLKEQESIDIRFSRPTKKAIKFWCSLQTSYFHEMSQKQELNVHVPYIGSHTVCTDPCFPAQYATRNRSDEQTDPSLFQSVEHKEENIILHPT